MTIRKIRSRSEAIMRHLIIDVASAPLPDAEQYLDGTVRAPANYKDPDKIAAYVAEKAADRLAEAALDIDLARITAIGTSLESTNISLSLCRDEQDERLALTELATRLTGVCLVTYNGHSFDLPLLMRRARYLGVTFPAINLDRFKSPHVDLLEVLSDRNPTRRRSLQFYVKRLGWTDLTKTLTGAEEAQVPVTGRWEDLADSLRQDITATYRLAQWLGVMARELVL
jgi:hypothetical protein